MITDEKFFEEDRKLQATPFSRYGNYEEKGNFLSISLMRSYLSRTDKVK
jgi:hypothetical protein